MKHIDKLFDDNNQHKFSFLLLAKDLVDHDTIIYLEHKLKEKINVVSIKSSKYSHDELQYAISRSDFIVTGLGKTLDIAINEDKKILVDVNSNKVSKSYPNTVDFFDPYRNEETKPFYKDKELKLLLKEVYNQLDRYEIDYVNFM